jgi:hypothetical protein
MSDRYPPAPPGAVRPHRLTRRRLLAGAFVLASGAVGVAVGLRPTVGPGRQAPPKPPRPARLQAALDREQQLISGLDRVASAHPALGQMLAPLRADHVTHAQVIEALLVGFAAPAPSRTVTSSTGAEQVPTLRALQAAEQAAGKAAGTDSAALTGELAVFFGSIAACEAAHVQLLT